MLSFICIRIDASCYLSLIKKSQHIHFFNIIIRSPLKIVSVQRNKKIFAWKCQLSENILYISTRSKDVKDPFLRKANVPEWKESVRTKNGMFSFHSGTRLECIACSTGNIVVYLNQTFYSDNTRFMIDKNKLFSKFFTDY